jgi:ribonuclease T2
MSLSIQRSVSAAAIGALLAQTASAIPVSGSFTADRPCPAYVSKNKQTNPDGARTTIGEAYDALEANKPDSPDWYRIRMPSADPKERWVSVQCGRFQPGGTGGTGGGGACDTAGQADGYVLALSWQPAFCETKPGKPECRVTDPTAYQARNFTLHGLWPNKKVCGIGYGFCGEVKRQEGDFCDYPEVPLQTATRASLAQVMPSVAAGSCLERHEWHKHGTCQDRWSDDEYFDLSSDLTRQFNEAGMAYFMNRRIGREVRTEDFLARLDAVLAPGTRQRVRMDCDNGMLVEIQISLPETLTPGADLDALIAQAPPTGGSDCGASFRVDPIGQ